jgi:hypothetical protein
MNTPTPLGSKSSLMSFPSWERAISGIGGPKANLEARSRDAGALQ